MITFRPYEQKRSWSQTWKDSNPKQREKVETKASLVDQAILGFVAENEIYLLRGFKLFITQLRSRNFLAAIEKVSNRHQEEVR